MRAIRVAEFGAPEVMKLADVDEPATISGNQVLVRLSAAGVNPVDTYIRSGAFGSLPELPFTPGSDGAGIVEKVGHDVKEVSVGDRVFISAGPDGRPGGTYASHTIAPASCVSRLPEALTFQQGAGIGIPYYTAWHALFQRAGAREGDSVLVHGASGAVGLAAVQMAKHFNMRVLGTAGTKEGLQLVKDQGADLVFNHRTKGYADQILTASEGGVDVILEMLANVNLNTDLKLLKYRGRVIVIGSRGTITIDPRLTMGKESSIIGCALLTSSRDDWKEMRAGIAQGLKDGWIQPVVDKEYPLEKAAQVHHDIIESKGARGNLVLNCE